MMSPVGNLLRPLITATVLMLIFNSSVTAKSPSLILVNGKIVTVDDKFAVVQAMAVDGERIVAIGSNADIVKLAGSETTKLDLHGRMVIPGLIDSHVHINGAAMYEYDHPIPEMETVADVLKYIAGRATSLSEGEWIVVRQVFITRLRDQRYPTRTELDSVAPRHPVMFATGPDCVCNSLALKLSGIDRDFQINDGKAGQIEHDPATGEPTGILRNASRFVKSKPNDKPVTTEDRIRRVKQLLADYNSAGLTSVADRNTSDESVSDYALMKERGELTCRLFLSYAVNGSASRQDVEAAIQKAADHPLHKYDNRVWLRGIKVFLDGGMLTGSAYMQQPWGRSDIYSITDPDYRGLRFIPQESLVAMARYALQRDLQFTAHSVGDAAVQALIDAYAEINRDFPVAPCRPCITHCNFMSLNGIRQMKSLGIVADLQPAWLWLDGATLRKQFGDERLTWFQPYKTLFEEVVVVGGGSDHMQKIGSLRWINPCNPFLGMWIALTRQPRRADQQLHPEQSITREQALRLYTINNAWLTFEEKEKGSLEPGKLADFVVLDRDILTCPTEDVRSAKVLHTYVGGVPVFRLEDLASVAQKIVFEIATGIPMKTQIDGRTKVIDNQLVGKSGNYIAELTTSDHESVGCFAYSPDGKLLAVGIRYNSYTRRSNNGTIRGYLRIHNAISGELLRDSGPSVIGPVEHIAFSEDGSKVLYQTGKYQEIGGK